MLSAYLLHALASLTFIHVPVGVAGRAYFVSGTDLVGGAYLVGGAFPRGSAYLVGRTVVVGRAYLVGRAGVADAAWHSLTSVFVAF